MVEPLKQLLCLPAVKVCIKHIAFIYLPANCWLLERHCYLHACSCFLDRFSALLYLMHRAYLLAFFIYRVHFLPEPAYLNLGAKDGGIATPKNETLQELELAYRWQLVEQYQFLMLTLVRYPVCVASYEVIDYLLVKDLHPAVLRLLLCILK